MGQRLISLKGEAGWGGKTTQAVNDRGQRRLLKLENGYVSADGSEIRSFPGFVTLLDLTEENNPVDGYAGYVPDGVRPIYETTPTEDYQFFSYLEQSRRQTLYARAKPVTFFGFEQIGDTIVILGESRFREALIYGTGRIQSTPSQVGIVSGKWVIRMVPDPEANSADNASGAGLNGVQAGHVVYIEGATVSDATLQAAIDTNLNGRCHEVKTVSGDEITLHTDGSPNTALTNVSGAGLHRVRYNRNDSYSTPNGLDPYDTTYDNRPDDPDALTAWRVIGGLEIGDTLKQCYPAWVANRQRDFGDALSVQDREGIRQDSAGVRGVSRREQRQLPYRPNIEPAVDRVLLAAPGYGCMFQVPLLLNVDQDAFLDGTPSDSGLSFQPNDVFDKPRSLGIPKARLVDCTFTPAPTSPSIADPGAEGFNFNLVAAEVSPEFGLAPGEYKVAISFEDEALGEEGLASEPIIVEVPDNTYAYTVVLHYLHPGYVMPECLALKMNVYIAPPGDDALQYYASFPLMDNTFTFGPAETDDDLSAKYGFPPTSPDDPHALIGRLQLPLKGSGNDISDDLDATRLAPLSASMPRGAEACKYIRGVLLAGGHQGNTGSSLQLWEARATALWGTSNFHEPDVFYIRAHGEDASVPSATLDGDTQNGTLGIAGRAFPDAYQGIEANALPLLPGGSTHVTIDRVLNRKADSVVSGHEVAHYERLRVTRDIWDRMRALDETPVGSVVTRTSKYIWYEMQKGQIQVGDPGAPNRSSKAAIKIVDPIRGDDITAIGHVAGNAILCSRKETYSLSWYTAPGGQEAQLISNEFGCIGSNTMVEFDGGLAWLSERGPVAIGASLQHVGRDVQEDFFGELRRYQFDSRGMMRHAWGCHDAQRGLVLWGLSTVNNVNFFTYQNQSYLWVTAPNDEAKSRCPCDEVLVWSYRTNTFSTWRPPVNLGIYWMRPLRLANGEVRVCFLAADGRLYALDDIAHDCNPANSTQSCEFDVVGAGTSSQTLTFSVSNPGVDDSDAHDPGRDEGQFHLRVGMAVEILNENGELVGETSIQSVDTLTANTATITMVAAQTWKYNYTVRVGARPKLTLITTYIGAETMDTISADAVQARFTLLGHGSANAKVSYLKTDADNTSSAKTVTAVPASAWLNLGSASSSWSDPETRVGFRKRISQGGVDAPEIAVKVEITGAAQVRLADLALEVG